jgi:hypothetical protein
VVAHPLAGVASGRNQTSIGGEPVSTLESADVAHGHQKLGPEDRSHARQASENPSLGTGEKTLPKLLVEGVDRARVIEREGEAFLKAAEAMKLTEPPMRSSMTLSRMIVVDSLCCQSRRVSAGPRAGPRSALVELHVPVEVISPGFRRVLEADGLLTGNQLADRVCDAYRCPHEPHLVMPEKVA